MRQSCVQEELSRDGAAVANLICQRIKLIGGGAKEGKRGRRMAWLFNAEGEAGVSSTCFCSSTQAAACPCTRRDEKGAVVVSGKQLGGSCFR